MTPGTSSPTIPFTRSVTWRVAPSSSDPMSLATRACYSSHASPSLPEPYDPLGDLCAAADERGMDVERVGGLPAQRSARLHAPRVLYAERVRGPLPYRSMPFQSGGAGVCMRSRLRRRTLRHLDDPRGVAALSRSDARLPPRALLRGVGGRGDLPAWSVLLYPLPGSGPPSRGRCGEGPSLCPRRTGAPVRGR